MASYLEWNAALADHVTGQLPQGSRVCLHVDADVLGTLGRRHWPTGETICWQDVFLQALREQLVDCGRVRLGALGYRDAAGRPLGVAFLGVLVLAAASASHGPRAPQRAAYLTRVCGFLGVPRNAAGRPPGFPAGAELPLWEDWNAYLHGLGLQPTASGGHGSHRFTTFPFSQLSGTRL
ncbi:hypothetical protein [Deinococcus gobiensis]|uniref:Uncharacterized protein n=1 Tax=Deinococcus gobiensis (strain DSM 21396 / JCM 16679 / CGMCC 1.7299 / I-0) TaxID=745776 RepID=H8H3M5_DEIGI|nr:hypothetical protein [Deinococcus gobiensis]AFD28122.1 hypothetical protein DGo_PD0048 [Deinococcus gobiensis I-0]